jgi:hypothetical protein
MRARKPAAQRHTGSLDVLAMALVTLLILALML